MVKVYWKKEMVERAIIRIIHNKIIEFTSRRMYGTFKPRVNIIIFMHLSTITV